MTKPKIIKGLEALANYLTKIGISANKQTALGYVQDGLPHWRRGPGKIYHFHIEKIDEFFKNLCKGG